MVAFKKITPSVINRCAVKATTARSKLPITIHHKKTR